MDRGRSDLFGLKLDKFFRHFYFFLAFFFLINRERFACWDFIPNPNFVIISFAFLMYEFPVFLLLVRVGFLRGFLEVCRSLNFLILLSAFL